MGESSCCIADELVLVLPRRHRLKLASPGRYSLCRSTRPGCEQRSVPAGSMGESSCCIADELVLVLPRRHRHTLSPGRRGLVGAPAPGVNSVVRLLARWVSPPAASRTSWCSSLPGLHWLGLASPSSPTLARRHRRRSAGALHPGGGASRERRAQAR